MGTHPKGFLTRTFHKRKKTSGHNMQRLISLGIGGEGEGQLK